MAQKRRVGCGVGKAQFRERQPGIATVVAFKRLGQIGLIAIAGLDVILYLLHAIAETGRGLSWFERLLHGPVPWLWLSGGSQPALQLFLLSLRQVRVHPQVTVTCLDRKSTRLNSSH